MFEDRRDNGMDLPISGRRRRSGIKGERRIIDGFLRDFAKRNISKMVCERLEKALIAGCRDIASDGGYGPRFLRRRKATTFDFFLPFEEEFSRFVSVRSFTTSFQADPEVPASDSIIGRPAFPGRS